MSIASDGQLLGFEISPGIFEPGGVMSPGTRKRIFRHVVNAGAKGIEFTALRYRCAYDLPSNEEFNAALAEAIASGAVTLLRPPWEPSKTHAYGWMHVNRAETPLLRVTDIETAHLPLDRLGIAPVASPADLAMPSPLEDRILQILADAGPEGLTLSQIIRKTGAVASRTRTPILAALVEGGRVARARIQTATKPMTVYRLEADNG